MTNRPTVFIETEDGEVEEIYLPYVWQICDDCKGSGTRDNLGAITADEWNNDWDDDEKEMYLSGAYDVRCEDCDGTGKVQVVDTERCDPKLRGSYYEQLLAAYYEQQADMAADRAMREMEGRMGC